MSTSYNEPTPPGEKMPTDNELGACELCGAVDEVCARCGGRRGDRSLKAWLEELHPLMVVDVSDEDLNAFSDMFREMAERSGLAVHLIQEPSKPDD